MWPLPATTVVELCGGECAATGLPDIHAVSVGEHRPAPGQLFMPIAEDVDAHALVGPVLARGATLAVVASSWAGLADLDAGQRHRCVVVDDVLAAYRSFATAFRRRFRFPVLAVGGSQGKTTVKEMVAALLATCGAVVSRTPQTMNGYAGIPFTLCSQEHHRDRAPEALVIEIGIDALGAMADHVAVVAPDVAVLTAAGVEHSRGLGSAEAAAREEWRLLEAAPRRVFLADDPRIRAAMMPKAGDVVVSSEAMALPSGVGWLRYSPRRTSVRGSEVALAYHLDGATDIGRRVTDMGGAHNARNLAVAVASAIALDVAPRASLLGVEARVTVQVPMRCEIRQLEGGVTIVDDAYNASPDSMSAAFALLEAPEWRHRPRVMVLGDMLDLGQASQGHHRALVERLPAGDLVAVGDAMAELQDRSRRWYPADVGADVLVDGLSVVPGTVVLVKGSRGMRLERVVRALMARPARAITPRVAVVGRDRDAAAPMIAAARGRLGSGEVVAWSADALVSSPPMDGVVSFIAFERDASVVVPPGESPNEFHLALMAQPFMRLHPKSTAWIGSGEAGDALSMVVPAHAATVRFGEGTPWSGSLDGEGWVVSRGNTCAPPIRWLPPRLRAAAILALGLAWGDPEDRQRAVTAVEAVSLGR